MQIFAQINLGTDPLTIFSHFIYFFGANPSLTSENKISCSDVSGDAAQLYNRISNDWVQQILNQPTTWQQFYGFGHADMVKITC